MNKSKGGIMNESLEKRVSLIITNVQGLIVKDQDSLTAANQFILGIKSMRKEIADTFDPIIDQTNKAHKEALLQKARHDKPLWDAELLLKQRTTGYLIEEDRKCREAEIARARAEAERRRIEEEAMLKAQIAENLAKETKDESIKRKAIQESNYFLEQAAAQEEKIVNEMPKEIEKPKVEGLSMRDHWTFEIIDESQIPREFLIVDRQKINLIVQQYKEMANISGVRIYCEKIMAARIR